MPQTFQYIYYNVHSPELMKISASAPVQQGIFFVEFDAIALQTGLYIPLVRARLALVYHRQTICTLYMLVVPRAESDFSGRIF